MPIYSFKCSRCLNYFDQVFSIHETKTPVCPHCGWNKIWRVFNATPILYKSSGFYSKDNQK